MNGTPQLCDLGKKVVLVTGAASGIGKATAKLFASHGASVVVGDLVEESGRRTVTEIEEAGGTARFKRCDVSNLAEVKMLVQFAVDEFGGLDIAHNNAGFDIPRTKVVDVTADQWDRIISVDLTSVFYCMKEEIPRMLERGGGAIVNTSSGAGLIGVGGGAPYTAAKHGVVGLTKSAALDYAADGVRVNAICPGLIRTPLVDHALGDEVATYEQRIPMGRLGTPDDVAMTVVWLCSSASSYYTGQTLSMDGGAMVGSV
jgi:NAD(P)-dependent dehydrogenase (short-subunit alcohol dehydrogenase family)